MNILRFNKKFLLFPVMTLVTLYIVGGIWLYVKQRDFIYYPDKKQDFEDCEGFKEYEKIVDNELRFYYLDQKSNRVIIYYHGNAGSACNRSIFKDFFEEKNTDLIFVEYPGYSGDRESPSERRNLAIVRNLDKYIERKDYKEVMVYGRSIGTGVASYHASLGSVDKLILVSPFYSMEDLVQAKMKSYPTNLLLKDKYLSYLWLQEYKGELLIFHGKEDKVIPFSQSRKLFNDIPLEKRSKEYVLIEGRGHNDIWSSDKFLSRLSDFLGE